MQKQFREYLQKSLVFLDLLMLNLTLLLLRTLLLEKEIDPSYRQSYLQMWVVINLIWVLIALGGRTYSGAIILNFEAFTKRTVQVFLLWVIGLLFYLFFSRQYDLSRLFIFACIIGFAAGLLVNRFIYIGISNYFRRTNFLHNNVLIIGFNATAKKLEEYFSEEGINSRVVGFVEEEANVKELSRHPIITDISKTVEAAIEMEVQEIYSTITPEQNPLIYSLMNKAEMECIRFKIVPDFNLFINKPVVINYIGELPVLSLRSEPLDDMGNRIKKRILDLLVSVPVTLLILTWLIPLMALLIKLSSRGPVFFKQMRNGRNNKPFVCYKFRSMYINTDADARQARRNDERITPIGRFIRKTSLDEFPQFINVLIGNMSLVGPRPHMLKHTSQYSQVVENFMVRHFVKPGITGWAQVNGYRGEITEMAQLENRVFLDLYYLENWSIWLDIRILFMTIYGIVKGEKNAF
jgi:putative colanic acid biosynthesis UDP-glucose lipid carrier transferase